MEDEEYTKFFLEQYSLRKIDFKKLITKYFD